MNRILALGFDGSHLVDRLADDIDDAAQARLPDRNRNRAPSIFRRHAANHAVRGLQRNRTHAAFAEMLLHFDDDIDRCRHIEAFTRDVQRLVNRRLFAFVEFHVDCRTDDL